MRLLTLVLVIVLAGCTAQTVRWQPLRPVVVGESAQPGMAGAASVIAVHRISRVSDIPTTPVLAGTFRIYAFDVGTGLSMLVQGKDFAMLYDGGTNDSAEDSDRVLSFLFATVGASGGDRCVPPGDGFVASAAVLTIDHVFLSHPHQDHGSGLARVLQCYQVDNVWDSGAINNAGFYRAFVAAVAEEAGSTYHTASSPPLNRDVVFDDETVVIPRSVTWTSFSEDDVVELGVGARLIVLNADGKQRSDRNANSIVVRIELGLTSTLLTGDAGSAKRADPSDKPTGLEAYLLERHAAALDVDILQVGHHGSMTSSRTAFLAAISPRFAVISSGPRKYGRVVLPDEAVVAAVADTGAVLLRTDVHDAGCPAIDHVGLDDNGPGGCDSFLFELGSADVGDERATVTRE